MSSYTTGLPTASRPAVAKSVKLAISHWNSWPNEKGFDPENEERDPIEISVTGHFPAYAAGTLYRTGPGKSQVQMENGELFQLAHWFDGFIQTHRFQILVSGDSTRILYNSHFSTDALIDQVRRTGCTDTLSFAQKYNRFKTGLNKCQTEFVSPTSPDSRNIGMTLSVNMPGFDSLPEDESSGRWDTSKGIRTLYAKSDHSMVQRLDPETLEPIGLAIQESLHPELNGPLSASHARSDPKTGDMFNFNLSLGQTSTYRVFRISAATGKTKILATFPGIPAYINSLLITEDYVLLCVWNSHLNAAAMGTVPFIDTIYPTDPSQPATWYVVDRKNDQGLIATYESPAFYCSHTINSWQEPSKDDPSKTDIVADLVRFDNDEYLRHLSYENVKSSWVSAKRFAAKKGDALRSTITRFRLPLVLAAPSSGIKKCHIEWSACKEISPELPTMSPKLVAQKHRYTYALTMRGESTFMDGIMKFDNDTHEVGLWTCHGHTPGEPIFVANPDGESEDDGVLLSVVLDGTRGTSYLLCLDARTLTELGRANVRRTIGVGFHGQHVPTVGLPTGDY